MKRVLVVDDEPMLRLLLRMVLENEGHEVTEAGDGVAALVEIEESRPDVVVTDLTMPEMGGADLVRKLRRDPSTADIPIIVTSARIPIGLEADATFRKPYEASEIAKAIVPILEHGTTA